jgi:uncharacterized protein YjbJ (UPF0337 family)
MTDQTQSDTDQTQSDAAQTQAPSADMRGEIQQKWGKFSAEEIRTLKDKNDLVEKVQAKYGLERPQAQRDVDAFANGRQF